MPTSCRKARLLLKEGKATVVKRFPFTIKLNYECTGYKQLITLGVDTGYRFVGVSATTDTKEVFAAEVELRVDIVKKLSNKRMYRRNRRYRLRYRQARFLNRKGNDLAPSIHHKLNSHLRIVEEVYKILPISKIVVEVADFDIQKIMNPEIEGVDYQNGVQTDFWNVREYVLYRDNHQCQHCKKKNAVLNVHHIETRKTGGNRPDNLITLCEDCHELYHEGKIKLKVKKTKGFKAEAFMNIVKKRIVNELKKRYLNVEYTYGYLTKSKRIELKLEKSHSNDAFCIDNEEGDQKRVYCYSIFQKRKNNRSLQKNRKGFGISIRRQRYPIQPYDIIYKEDNTYISKGSFNQGTWFWIKNNENKNKGISYKGIDKIFHTSTFVYLN